MDTFNTATEQFKVAEFLSIYNKSPQDDNNHNELTEFFESDIINYQTDSPLLPPKKNESNI